MLCDFIVEGQGWYRCSNCNIQLRSNDGQPPVFPCRNTTFKRPNESKPSFINKVKNFAKATSEHISQGMKLASDETISKRYSILSAGVDGLSAIPALTPKLLISWIVL